MHSLSPGEIGGDEQQGEDHSRYAIIDELLASYAVNDDKGKDGGEHVYESYENLDWRGICRKKRDFKEEMVLLTLKISMLKN